MPFKQLTKHVVFYGLSSVLGRAFHFLLVPLHTRLLLPAHVGVISELYMYLALLSLVYAGGMDMAYLRFGATDPGCIRIAWRILFRWVGLLTGLLLLLAPWAAQGIHHPHAQGYFYWMAVILAADAFALLPLTQLRLKQKSLQFSSMQLLHMVSNAGLNVVLLGVHQAGYLKADPVLLVLLANGIASGVRLVYASRGFELRAREAATHSVRDLLQYGLPLLSVSLLGVYSDMLPRFALKYWLSPSATLFDSPEVMVGVFSAVSKLAVLMNIGIQAFRYAAEPFFFRSSTTRDPKKYAQLLEGFVLVGIGIWWGISTNINLLGHLFLQRPIYRAHVAIVPYLVLGYLLLGIYYNLTVWFKQQRKMRYAWQLALLGAICTTAVQWFWVPQFGYWGCVLGQLVGYGSMVVTGGVLSAQNSDIPYRWGRLVLYVGVAGVAIALLQYLPATSLGLTFLRGALLSAVYPLIGAGAWWLHRKKHLAANIVPDSNKP